MNRTNLTDKNKNLSIEAIEAAAHGSAPKQRKKMQIVLLRAISSKSRVVLQHSQSRFDPRSILDHAISGEKADTRVKGPRSPAALGVQKRGGVLTGPCRGPHAGTYPEASRNARMPSEESASRQRCCESHLSCERAKRPLEKLRASYT